MAQIVIQNALFPHPLGLGRALDGPADHPLVHLHRAGESPTSGCTRRTRERRAIAVETFTQPLADVDRAVLDGDDAGFARVHVRKGTDRILGATIVAADAGNLISEVTVAMKAGGRTRHDRRGDPPVSDAGGGAAQGGHATAQGALQRPAAIRPPTLVRLDALTAALSIRGPAAAPGRRPQSKRSGRAGGHHSPNVIPLAGHVRRARQRGIGVVQMDEPHLGGGPRQPAAGVRDQRVADLVERAACDLVGGAERPVEERQGRRRRPGPGCPGPSGPSDRRPE